MTTSASPAPAGHSAAAETVGALDRAAGELREARAPEPIVEGLRALRSDVGKPCVLAVVGQVNAGKSTFINALLGDDKAIVDSTETTATINHFVYGQPDPERPVRCFWRGGRVTEESSEFLASLQGNDLETLERDLRRFEEAIATYDRVLALDPSAAEAAIGRGETRRRLHRLDEALADFELALSVCPNSASALVGRARVLVEQYRLDEGFGDLARALELEPDSAEPLIARGWANLTRRNPHAAIEDFQRALELVPGSSEALAGRGLAKTTLGDIREAVQDFDRALELDGDCVPSLAGHAMARVGTEEDWIGELERVLGVPQEDAPGDSTPTSGVDRAVEGLRRYARERNAEASAALGWAGGLRRGSVKEMVAQAVSGGSARAPEGDCLGRALELDPKDPRALLALAAQHAAGGDLEAASRALDAALAANEHDAEAMLARAIVTMNARRPADSLLDLDRALELAPFWADLAAARGFAHPAQEQFDAAIDDFDLALGVPETLTVCSLSQVRLLRGRSLLRLDRTRDAVAELTTAMTLDPGSVHARVARGQAHLRLGSHAAAIDDAQRAAELDASSGEARRLRAQAVALAAVAAASGEQPAPGEARRAHNGALVEAAEIENGWKPDQLRALLERLDGSELPVYLFRCARLPDVRRIVVLAITSSRLVWSRRGQFGGADAGHLPLAAVEEVREELGGMALVSGDEVALRLRAFGAGVDLMGSAASLSGGEDARELVQALVRANRR